MKRLLGYGAGAAALAAMLLAVSACGGTQSPAAAGKAPDAEKSAASSSAPAEEGLGMAKDVTVLAEDGAHVQLQSAWLNTHAVIIFLRGHWWPYCIKQLGELQQNLDKFHALNANLVAITHDPRDPEKMRAKAGVTFTLYTDPDLVAIKAFEVLDEANSIARPAAFLVSTDGKILFRYVGENASDTVLLKVLFAELEKLEQPAP